MQKDNYNNFKKLLKEGEAGEDVVIKFLEDRGNKILDTARDKGKFLDWDVMIEAVDKTVRTIEIKTDKSSSANLAVEFKSRGKPSGILSTKADFYFIYFVNDGKIYTCNSASLRLWIAENPPKVVMNKQNDSETYLYLIPKSAGIFKPHEVA